MVCQGLPVIREGSADVDEGAFERGRVVLRGFEDIQATHVVGPVVLQAGCLYSYLLRVRKSRCEAEKNNYSYSVFHCSSFFEGLLESSLFNCIWFTLRRRERN